MRNSKGEGTAATLSIVSLLHPFFGDLGMVNAADLDNTHRSNWHRHIARIEPYDWITRNTGKPHFGMLWHGNTMC